MTDIVTITPNPAVDVSTTVETSTAGLGVIVTMSVMDQRAGALAMLASKNDFRPRKLMSGLVTMWTGMPRR